MAIRKARTRFTYEFFLTLRIIATNFSVIFNRSLTLPALVW
jgi:hypothetical protein